MRQMRSGFASCDQTDGALNVAQPNVRRALNAAMLGNRSVKIFWVQSCRRQR
jgi:hypothetical protein